MAALGATILCGVAIAKSSGMRDNEWRQYILPSYLCAAVLWMISSYTLAQAKGYQSDALGRVLLISFFLGFCCQPAALIFPFLGFFLEDKARPRRRSRRRHGSREPH